jgi:hypothetical protein
MNNIHGTTTSWYANIFVAPGNQQQLSCILGHANEFVAHVVQRIKGYIEKCATLACE